MPQKACVTRTKADVRVLKGFRQNDEKSEEYNRTKKNRHHTEMNRKKNRVNGEQHKFNSHHQHHIAIILLFHECVSACLLLFCLHSMLFHMDFSTLDLIARMLLLYYFRSIFIFLFQFYSNICDSQKQQQQQQRNDNSE